MNLSETEREEQRKIELFAPLSVSERGWGEVTASKYFGHQRNYVAYEKTLDLLKNLRQQIQLATEIA